MRPCFRLPPRATSGYDGTRESAQTVAVGQGEIRLGHRKQKHFTSQLQSNLVAKHQLLDPSPAIALSLSLVPNAQHISSHLSKHSTSTPIALRIDIIPNINLPTSTSLHRSSRSIPTDTVPSAGISTPSAITTFIPFIGRLRAALV